MRSVPSAATPTFDFANVSNVGPANQADLGNGEFAFFKEGSRQVEVVPEPLNYALLALAAAGANSADRRLASTPAPRQAGLFFAGYRPSGLIDCSQKRSRKKNS